MTKNLSLALLAVSVLSVIVVCLRPAAAQEPAPALSALDPREARKAEKKLLGRPVAILTNRVAVKIRAGASAEAVAARQGAELKFMIAALPGWCEIAFADARTATAMVPVLLRDPDVAEAVQQRLSPARKKITDPYYTDQWHLVNTGQTGGTVGRDIAVTPAWTDGITGTGVLVSIVDDGVQTAHPDLAAGYVAASSFDYVSNDTNPNPAIAADDHGTQCAGIAIARNNGVGVVGAAYDASWAAVRLLGANQSDSTEAASVTHALANVHVYSNSWGQPDTGDYWDAGPLTIAALQNGVATGRSGRGAIYIWAAGNGYGTDDSNMDGYTIQPEVVSVASIDKDGADSTYSESGANILVTAPGGEGDIMTTDRTGAAGANDGSVFADADYSNDFSGTSAATPMVSGVAALMLQANPLLTWRDVQHILVYSSDPNKVSGPFTQTPAGLRVSSRWGFGMVQAWRAVEMAESWVNVPARQTTTTSFDNANAPIPDQSPTGITRTILVPPGLYLEHVIVEMTSNHTWWGDLRVTLTAPSGTESELALAQGGFSPNGTTWRYMTVRHWGESAGGTWELKVADEIAQDTGSLQSWRLILHGTSARPNQGGMITNTTLADAGQFTAYSHQFALSGTGGGVVWSWSGSTPTGLALSPTTGQITGMATVTGDFNFTVTATAMTPPALATANIMLHVNPYQPPAGGTQLGARGGGGGTCAVGSAGSLLAPILAMLGLGFAGSRGRAVRRR